MGVAFLYFHALRSEAVAVYSKRYLIALFVPVLFLAAVTELSTKALAGVAVWDITTSSSRSLVSPISIPKNTPIPYNVTMSASGIVKTESPTDVTSTVDIPTIDFSGFSHTFALKEAGQYQVEETYTLTINILGLGESQRFVRTDTWQYSDSTPTLALFRLEDMYVDSYTYETQGDAIGIKSITPPLGRPGETGRIEFVTLRDIKAGETIYITMILSAKWHKISSMNPTADNQPPSVDHTPTSPIEAGSPITAVVTDNLQVDFVNLYFKDASHNEFLQIAMTPTGEQDTYSGNIPENAAEGDAQYYFVAKDISNNEITYPPRPYSVFVIAIKFGDVNNDGVVNDQDAMLVLQDAVGIISFTPEQQFLGDVSGNGTGSSYDAGLILQYARGLINSFPVQNQGSASLSESIIASVVEMSIPYATGLPGSSVIIPVSVKNAGGWGIIGIDINLTYASNILTALNALTQGTIASEWLIAYKITNSQMVIGMASSSQLSDQGNFVKLGFSVSGAAIGGQSSPLTFSNLSLNEDGVFADKTDGLFEVFEQLDIHLHQGWNLISISLDIEDTDLLSILDPIKNLCRSVWTYNTNPGWKRYIFGKPGFPNDLDTIVPGKGYFIDMADQAVLTILGKRITNTAIQLSPGLNMAGYNSLTPSAPENAFSSLPNGTSIWTYDTATGVWLSYVVGDPDFFNEIEQLRSGKGYIIYAPSNCEWIISP